MAGNSNNFKEIRGPEIKKNKSERKKTGNERKLNKLKKRKGNYKKSKIMNDNDRK